MSGRTLVPALVLVLLAVPAGASAKGVQDAQVCGPAGCAPAPLNADTYLVFEGGVPARTPTEKAPFYRLRYRMMTHEGSDTETALMRMDFVPSTGLLRAEDGTWLHPDARAAEALRRHLTGVEPFPAAKLELPGAREPRAPAGAASGGSGGIEPLPIVAAVLLGGGAALVIGSRRRRRPAAG